MKNGMMAFGIASACIPFAAAAQGAVQIGGQLKIGVDAVSYSGARDARGNVIRASGSRLTDNSSYLYFKGEEDLGGDLRAFFHIENGFASDTGNAGSPRFYAVGLKHPSWGRILLGKWSTYFASDGMLTPGGIRDAGPYASGTLNLLGPIGRRGQYFSGGFLSNTVRYDSPNWAGLTVGASYSFDTEATDQSSHRTLNFNPVYVNGPFTLYFNALYRQHQPNAAGNFNTDYDQLSMRAGAGYEFGNGLKIALLWDRNRVEGSAIAGGKLVRDAWAIPLRYRLRQHQFSITYGQALDYKTAGVSTPDTGAKMVSIGYEYALSKRTALAANFSTVRNEARAGYDFWQPSNTLPVSASTTGFTSRYTYLGVKHVF